jgi:hypothetical protein
MAATQGGLLLFDGTVVNEPGSTHKTAGKIAATGSGSEIDFTAGVFNFGAIAARHGGLVKFEGGAVINEPAGLDQVAGKIVSRGLGSEIDFASVTLINAGLVAATHHGLVILDQTNVDNTGGRIAAHGDGSRILDDRGRHACDRWP